LQGLCFVGGHTRRRVEGNVAASRSDKRPAVLVLYNQVDAVIKGESIDLISDQETARVAHEIAAGLTGLGYRTQALGVRQDVAQALTPYSPAEWVVFNLIESLAGDSALEQTVPPIYEALGFHYTGNRAPAMARCLDKAGTKAFLAAHGLDTPRYALLSAPDEPCPVPLPAIVKPSAEDASVGITYDSVVSDASALARRVAYIIERYRQPALVEEFIDGREFNCAIWGNEQPESLPISEISFEDFPDPLQRILTYESKWVEDSFAYHHTPGICPARVEPETADRLNRAAREAYLLTGCRGYARVDIRWRDGTPFIMEVNPNPSLAPEGGFVRAAAASGFDYAHMAERILLLAMA